MDTNALARLGAVHDLTFDAGRVKFSAESDRVAEVLPALGALDVKGLTINPPSLEELFLRHYGDTTAGAPSEAGAGNGDHRHGTRRHLLGARGRA